MNSVAPVDYTQDDTTDKFNTIVQLDPDSKADLTWWSSLNRNNLSTPVVPPPDNDNLNLRHLTLKTIVLLALIRPSCLADWLS